MSTSLREMRLVRERFRRVALGDYETSDRRFRLYRLVGVYPPAWNVEDTEAEFVIVDGAAAMRDALALFAAWERRYCLACGADIEGNDPHGTGCPADPEPYEPGIGLPYHDTYAEKYGDR